MNTKELVSKLTASVNNTTKGASRPELYPVSSAVESETIDNVEIQLIKQDGRNRAGILDELGKPILTLDIKGIINEDEPPKTGKYVVLQAAESRSGVFQGREWSVEKGATKAHIVV